MPIPEPSLSRRSVLYTSTPEGKIKPASKDQRAEELAAIYGVSMTQSAELSHSEVERMRQIVAQHDTSNKNGMGTMDLNNPPKEPYQFKKFPMLVYLHSKCVPAHDSVKRSRVGGSFIEEEIHVLAYMHTRTVKTEAELEDAIDDGYQTEPPTFGEEAEKPAQEVALEDMTKEQLLAIASEHGLKIDGRIKRVEILEQVRSVAV